MIYDHSGRMNWDPLWMNFATLVSERSPHETFKVGAVIVSGDNTRVLSIGYNGDYSGGPNKVLSDEPGKSGFIHAEVNAIIKMDYISDPSKKMYLTLSPCIDCARVIINSGIKTVFYKNEYRDRSGIDLLLSQNISAYILKM
jgi:dCMP deaminase